MPEHIYTILHLSANDFNDKLQEYEVVLEKILYDFQKPSAEGIDKLLSLKYIP